MIKNELLLSKYKLAIGALVILATYTLIIDNIKSIFLLQDMLTYTAIAVCCGFIVYECSDIELLLSCKKSLLSVVYTRVTIYFSQYLAAVVFVIGLSFLFRSDMSIYIAKALLTSYVTGGLLFIGVMLLFTLIFKDTFAAQIANGIMIALLLCVHKILKEMPAWVRYVDPFYSSYSYSDTIWVKNRIILIAIAVVLLSFSTLLLFQRKNIIK